ncbi:uncharacterized protein LOC112087872 [Eutrema salsugineum]|uniref:uncharacterized protein LOC112087872 n=1 Tax=Eutrema salsugineum TaxID=72664 RepID=UPI000CED3F07|nr:uncharacterized protein LOC112087872 [Eutrema salsugineum]
MARKGIKLRNRSLPSDPDDASPRVSKPSSSGKSSSSKEIPHREASSIPLIAPNHVSPGYDSIDSIHNPFCLLSGDHPGMNLVSDILTGENYNTWIINMRTSLEAKNKISFVDGSLPRPAESDPLYKIWTRCNSMVKAWILNAVSKQISASILYFDDASDMWIDLHNRFHKSNLPLIYNLDNEIYSLRQGDMDLSEYYTKMVTIWERLACTKNLIEKGGCRCSQVQKLLADHETTRIVQFLMGLNDEFAATRTQILNTKPRPSLSDMYNMLDQDEGQRKKKALQYSAPTAFQMHGQVNSQGNRSNNQGKSRPSCTHCGLSGHTVDHCYKVHGYPPGWKPKNQRQPQKFSAPMSANMALTDSVTTTEMGIDLTKDQIQQLIAYFSSKLQPQTAAITEVNNDVASSSINPAICQVTGSYKGIDDWQG